MLLTVQFPVSDLRYFLGESTDKLPFPVWPFAEVGSFMRNMGEVIDRPLGGLKSWIAENKVCNASNAIRFESGFNGLASFPCLSIKPVFRRYFSDGRLTGKFEIGFRIQSKKGRLDMTAFELNSLIEQLLSVKICVYYSGKRRVQPLYSISILLKSLYCSVTTPHQNDNLSTTKRLVFVSRPMLYVETAVGEVIKGVAKGSQYVPFNDLNLTVRHSKISIKINDYRLWIVQSTRASKSLVREFRLTLLRLNSLKEGLLYLCRALVAKGISPGPLSNESDRLQEYFNKDANRCFKLPENLGGSKFLSLIYDVEYEVSGSELGELQRYLTGELAFRRQIAIKTSTIFEKLREFKGDIIVGDSIKTEISGKNIQVGAIGKDIKQERMEIKQSNQMPVENSNLDDISKDLSLLIEILKKESASSEHFADMALVAQAKECADANDEQGMRDKLKKVGKWTLDIAKTLTLGVSSSAIFNSLVG